MRVFIVDWLGRGGIAQATEVLARELTATGRCVTVITRGGRELDRLSCDVVRGEGSGRIRAHVDLCRRAKRLILSQRPDVVVVQNFVLPVLERQVSIAARAVGARLVHVVHDHRHHSALAGNRLGLRSALSMADVIATHSEFVWDRVEAFTKRRDGIVIPLPVPVAARDSALARHGARPRLAVHFGVLKRSYKGTALATGLARRGVAGWSFSFAGVGAPAPGPGFDSMPGYWDGHDLSRLIGQSRAALLPYRMATQSAAVVLAQALGSVPVSTRVGGIPEQVAHGRDGLLLPVGAPRQEWAEALEVLEDDLSAEAMADRGRARAWSGHDRFVSEMSDLAG